MSTVVELFRRVVRALSTRTRTPYRVYSNAYCVHQLAYFVCRRAYCGHARWKATSCHSHQIKPHIVILFGLRSRLSWLECRLRPCVMRNATGSNPGRPVNFYQYHLGLPFMYELVIILCWTVRQLT